MHYELQFRFLECKVVTVNFQLSWYFLGLEMRKQKSCCSFFLSRWYLKTYQKKFFHDLTPALGSLQITSCLVALMANRQEAQSPRPLCTGQVREKDPTWGRGFKEGEDSYSYSDSLSYPLLPLLPATASRKLGNKGSSN